MHKIFTKTLFLGKIVHFLPQCHSTNEEAQKLLKNNNTIEGEVVIAKTQLSGKGQRGNTWESEPGKNLTFSIILKPSSIKISDQFGLHVITSLAMYDALYSILGKKMKIKWPNDIYYEDRKLGGILIENAIRANSIENAIIGIGLNVNQTEFSIAKATSLAEICLQNFDLNDMLESILVNLEKRYLKVKLDGIGQFFDQYKLRLYKYQTQHLFKDTSGSIKGKIVNIDKSGRLMIETDGQIRSYSFKEVEFL
ncbi:MAG: BirA family biotin operon repressor/biotin-[acetyl-CoA-carboxylase] ligase [Cyclobacteriaceae bacterium]